MSTKTQVSWSPIASWISTAATDESTPPESPQITLPVPTCAWIFATCSARSAAMRPVALHAGDLLHEVGQQLRAIGRVHHFGVEHGGVVAALLVDRDGEGRVLGRADDLEAFRQLRDAVAMAHPDGIALADFPEALEQRARRA